MRAATPNPATAARRGRPRMLNSGNTCLLDVGFISDSRFTNRVSGFDLETPIVKLSPESGLLLPTREESDATSAVRTPN